MPTPFDPDQYLSAGKAAAQGFDPDSYLETHSALKPSGEPRRGAILTAAERQRRAREQFLRENPRPTSLWDMNPEASPDAANFLLGLPELALSGVTGAAGNLADVATMADPGSHDWAYLPRTEPGKFAAQKMAALAAPVAEVAGAGYDKAFGTGPLAQTVKERGMQAAEAIGTVLGAAGARKILSPGERPSAPVSDPQSMGAAAASVDTSRLSPALRETIETAKAQGPLDRPVVERHIDADTLPIPVRLTEGQATQSPAKISQEMNLRGKNPERAEFYRQQNQALIDNLDEIRAEAGRTVVHRDNLQNGQALVDAYKEMDAPVLADINAKYQALRDAAGGEFPIDTQALLANVNAALKKELSTSKAPSDVMAALNEAAETGAMSLEGFEGLRTTLARIQRSASDGQERHAAGVIREQIERLPMQESSAQLKALADTARSASKARFDKLKADPAYRAAVEDGVEVGELSPESDGFVRKFVINGKGANLKRMRENLAGNEEAGNTIAVSALNYLKEGAEGRAKTGNFSQAGYNSALNHLSPRLKMLMTDETAELAQQLGRVANYTQFQPRGSFVNNSNTFVAAAAEGGKNILEGVANNKLLGVPAGTFVRKKLEGRAAEKQWLKATEPGAGVRLSRILKGSSEDGK